jgi:antitoxin HicB
MIDCRQYPVEVRPLAAEDGGGWLATFPDLPGCMGDGETPQAAIEDGYSAAAAWLKTAEESGDVIPRPGCGGESGRFVLRAPKSLHARIAARAAQEGVSMNTLLVALIAEGLGVKERHVG